MRLGLIENLIFLEIKTVLSHITFCLVDCGIYKFDSADFRKCLLERE